MAASTAMAPPAPRLIGAPGSGGGSPASFPAPPPGSSSSPSAPATLLSHGPADPAVDYDVDVTALYESVGRSDWDGAVDACRRRPIEAATWVIRRKRRKAASIDPATGRVVPDDGDVLWKFLPLHSACALDPPPAAIRALIRAHPDGPRTLDGQGLLPLHYACGARCSRESLYVLLMAFPRAALREDPNGMLPLHYLAQWGPRDGRGEGGTVDMVCVATGGKAGTARDGDGNTAEALAARATYVGSKGVARKIREYAEKHAAAPGAASPTTPMPTPSLGAGHAFGVAGSGTSTDKYSSFGDDAAEVVDDDTVIEHEPEGNVEIALSPRSDKFGVGNADENRRDPSSSKNHPRPKRAVRKDRYHSWDKPAGGGGGGLNGKYGIHHGRSFSWDQNDAGLQASPSNSGSTWTTQLDHPQAPSAKDFIGGPLVRQRSRSAPRGFVAARATPNSGYPPLSPRAVPTPRSHNRAGGASHQVGRHGRRERREPTSSASSEDARRDARLAELREELLGAGVVVPRAVPEAGPLPTVLERSQSSSTGVSGGRGKDDGAVDRRSDPAGKSSRSGSHSSASYGAQLTQHLRAVEGAEARGRADAEEEERQAREEREAMARREAEMEERRVAEEERALEQRRWEEAERERRKREDLEKRALEEAERRAQEEERAERLGLQEEADRRAREQREQEEADEAARAAEERWQEEMRAKERAKKEAKESQCRELERAIARLEAERERADRTRIAVDQLRSERERADSAERLFYEGVVINGKSEEREEVEVKAQEKTTAEEPLDVAKSTQKKGMHREEALLEEIRILKAEKERAEAALGRITMLATSGNSRDEEDGQEKEEVETREHGMGEHKEFAGVDAKSNNANNDDNDGMDSSPRSERSALVGSDGNHDNDDGTWASGRKNKSKDALQNKATGNGKSDIEHLMEEKAKLEMSIERLQRGDCASFKPHSILRGRAEAVIGVDSEASRDPPQKVTATETAMSEQLKEEKSKSTALNDKMKAILMEKEEVEKRLKEEKSKATTLHDQMVAILVEKEDTEKRHSKTVHNHLREVKSLRESLEKAADKMIELRNVEKEHMECRSKEIDWIAIQKNLEEEIERLTTNAIKNGKWEGANKKLEEQMKEMSEKCWAAQNNEYKARSELNDREKQWEEERVKLEDKCGLLQAEIEQLKDTARGTDSFSVVSSHASRDTRLLLDEKETEGMHTFYSKMKKEHDKTVAELESELQEERNSRTEGLSQIVTLQCQITTLEQDLRDAKQESEQAKNAREEFSLSSRSDHEVKVELSHLKHELRAKLNETEKSRQVFDAMTLQLQKREMELFGIKRQGETSPNEVLEVELKEKERSLFQQLEAAEDRVQQLEIALANEEQQNRNDIEEEHSYQQQIRELKRQIQKLREVDVGRSQMLRDAKRQHERAMQDKEEELAVEVRELKKKHERQNEEKDDLHLAELRECKKRSEDTLRAAAESHIKQMRDAKRKEQELIKKQDELLKEAEDMKMKELQAIQQKDEELENNVENIVKEKDEKFQKELGELQAELKRLREEKEEATEKNLNSSEIGAQLAECKKELERQCRDHKSELNVMKNTLKLQKSKENRLQGHIQSLETQITDMVSEYESRLQEAFCEHMRRSE